MPRKKDRHGIRQGSVRVPIGIKPEDCGMAVLTDSVAKATSFLVDRYPTVGTADLGYEGRLEADKWSAHVKGDFGDVGPLSLSLDGTMDVDTLGDGPTGRIAGSGTVGGRKWVTTGKAAYSLDRSLLSLKGDATIDDEPSWRWNSATDFFSREGAFGRYNGEFSSSKVIASRRQGLRRGNVIIAAWMGGEEGSWYHWLS